MGRKIATSIFLIGFIILLTGSCGSSRQQASTDESEDMRDKTGTTKGQEVRTTRATIRDHRHLDGCLFMLITPEKKKLYPLDMDTAYYKDGLKVRVRYRKKDAVTTCMAGENIEVLEIEKVE